MPCMNFKKRLQPARKAWKVITTKLHKKLLKPHISKSIKKPNNTINQLNKTTTRKKALFWNSLSLRVRLRRGKIHKKRRTIRSALGTSVPVFIDELFIEQNITTPETSKGHSKQIDDRQADIAGTSTYEEERNRNIDVAADDMWESLVLASPQMHEINERAEEFITRFRAELQQQEILARRL